ncbi:class II aldolase/adducin family protein [bacterium]|nr:class II aldolase/adducin family protein [bacterium]
MRTEIARREIIEIAQRMYRNGFVTGTSGNISVKINNEEILITTRGSNLAELQYDDLLICDKYGKLRTNRSITSEAPMHIEVYKQRSDVSAVIHAHPPYVIALGLAGLIIEDDLLPEVIMVLGSVPTAQFAVPSTDESAEVIRPLIKDHNGIILDRHGSLTVGNSLKQAWQRLELLETAAKIIYRAKTLGDLKHLTSDEMKRIKESAERYRSR